MKSPRLSGISVGHYPEDHFVDVDAVTAERSSVIVTASAPSPTGAVITTATPTPPVASGIEVEPDANEGHFVDVNTSAAELGALSALPSLPAAAAAAQTHTPATTPAAAMQQEASHSAHTVPDMRLMTPDDVSRAFLPQGCSPLKHA
jgi:hypothetical protein